MNLIKIFELIEIYFHNLRKSNPNADGQKLWQPIKNMLSKINIRADQWKHIKKEYQNIMFTPEFYIDGYGNKSIIEINHFVIQTVRIPLTEEPSIKKIIQIALNIGQYTGSGGKKKEWMHLENYLTKKNIQKMSSQIPENLMIELNSYLNSIKC